MKTMWMAAATVTVGLGGCGKAGASGTPYAAPPVSQGDGGDEVYSDAQMMTPETAKTVGVGHDTPEAAVMGYFASRMRGDDVWKDTLVKERSKKLEFGLREHDGWKFLEVTLVKRKRSKADKYWVKVKVKVKIQVGGKTDGGTDDVGVEQVDGEWFVSSVPS